MVWLIGAGLMAIDYSKVLNGLNREFIVIGRYIESAEIFEKKTGNKIITGGLEKYLKKAPPIPIAAIVSVSIEQLALVTEQLIRYGIKKILLEKPGGLNSAEIAKLSVLAEENDVVVLIAYNRRHYASILTAKKLIEEDGGVSSFHFEITEWSHVIKNHNKDIKVMNSWFLGNTTHVIDAAFFLGGEPEEVIAYTRGGVSWHPASSKFVGAGVSKTGALFSYHGNWEAPGRWALDILTNKRRYIFCPMEQLHIQEIGSLSVVPYPVDGELDTSYKPGLYLQVERFLNGDYDGFCNLNMQVRLSRIYEKMAGY